jgi:cytoskeletal protein RodZ
LTARPRQPKQSAASHEPDLDVENFHAATDSMARVVQRVRGENPPPGPRPRRRARRARVEEHPSARASETAPFHWRTPSSDDTLRRADRRGGDRRPLVIVAVVTVLVLAVVAVATAPSDDDTATTDDPATPADEAPDAGNGDEAVRTTTTAPRTTTTAPARVDVQQPSPGVVTVTAPAAELSVEATGQVWLRVTADGGDSADFVLEPGDRERFEAATTLQVRVGNPAGVVLRTAGTTIDLGDHGGQPLDLTLSSAPPPG